VPVLTREELWDQLPPDPRHLRSVDPTRLSGRERPTT
jgi:hypothetical protein